MTLLSMCRGVLGEIGWPRPSAVAASTDATAVQIFEIANAELQALSEEFNWPHLSTEYTFATVAAQSRYNLPADFRTVMPGSVFQASEYYALKGSVNAQEWHYRKEGLLGSLYKYAYRIVYVAGVPKMDLVSTPSSVQNLVLDYQSSEYARSSGGVSQPLYTTDTDVSKVPERLVRLGLSWRFRRAKGLDFSAELAEYNATIKTQISKLLDQADAEVGGRRYHMDSPITEGYVPDTGFGA